MNQATGGDRAHSRTGVAHRNCERAPDMTELVTTNRRAFANRLDRRTLRASCVGVAILAAMLAGTAQAQTGDGARGSTLDSDIVVTATKTEAAVTETPQAISVVTSEEMELRGVQDLNAALSYSSGRSAARRVGKESVSACRSRWWADHKKKKNNK